MLEPSTVLRRARGLAAAIALLLPLFAGCKQEGGGAKPAGSASASASSSAAATTPTTAPSTSASASASPSAQPSGAAVDPASDAAATGAGVADLAPVGAKPECQLQTTELATYLQRGEVAIAARDSGVSVSWLVQPPNKPDAQVAFGGYDWQTKPTARVRGVGSARERAPRVFWAGGAWTVTWFDADGLAFTRPAWEKMAAPTPEHLRAVNKEVADDIALAATPAGALVAVAPFGPERGQLGLFLFAPTDPAARPVDALGMSRHAAGKPRRPAVAADAEGYYVAWLGDGDVINVSHFDLKGKEADVAALAAPGPKRESLSLTATASGATAVWIEDGAVVVRALTKLARPSGPPMIVAKSARHPAVSPLGDGALIVWVGAEGKSEGQVFAAKVGADGAPSAKGLVLTDEGRVAKDPPALAVLGGRAAFAWSEVMSATVSTKRALLRTIEVACIP